MSDWTVEGLVEDYKAGRVSRRRFVSTLAGVGVSMPVIAAILSACGGDSKSTTSTSKEATTGSGVATTAPQAAATGNAPTKRGGGGQLKLFWWQAPSILNPHQSSGTKDRDGSAIFLEPLAWFDAEANIFPVLASEAPSIDKGTVDKAGKFVVWKLKKDVTWHDGKPFTAEDVIFTWQYAADPETAALTTGGYKNIQTIEKVDDLTVRVVFKEPTLDWATPFATSQGMILPKHIHEAYKGKEAKNAPANLKPVGTGPYKLTEFRPNDLVLAEINDKYHVANRPFFDKLEMKGGGDAVGAARAVLQTGEYDYAWNLQVPATDLDALEKSGQGRVIVWQGGSIEHVMLNYTDPNVEVDGERSSLKAPHPFFTDLKVRQAFALAMDRKTIVDALYGKTGEVAVFYAYTPKKYVPAGTWSKDIAKANALLDEAGWKKGGDGIRAKDGKKMSVVFQTSVNKLRQDTQAVIKKDLESLGVQVELKSVIADVFFAADPANPDNFPHFYTDMQMFTATRGGPDDLLIFLQSFLSTEVKQKANQWSLANSSRYRSQKFDSLYAQAQKELDPVKAADLFKQMQTVLYEDIAVVPLVARGTVGAAKKNLQGMDSSGWASDLYKLPFWNRTG